MTDPNSELGEVPAQHDPAHFRYVLGQYPTGVALITARRPAGDPVGMVVGTFSSVSLDPPLVAFMPDRKSSSWPKIREAGSFCANVLTSSQEDVCRAFALKRDDRFTASSWQSTGSGNPRLEGVAAWIECTIQDVIPAGDHDIVLGRVQELGVGDSSDLPLLFLRGGYGSFSIPSIQSLDISLPGHMRAVDVSRAEIESLARELNLECLISLAVDDTIVVASAAGVESSPLGSPTRVGVAFPLAFPLAPAHVAWAGADAERRWLAHGRKLLGPFEPSLAQEELAVVRARGYAVATGSATYAEWERSIESATDPGATDVTGVMRQLLARIQSGDNQLSADRYISSLQAPVFGADGKVTIALNLNGFSGGETNAELSDCVDRLLASAAKITQLLGGEVPPTEKGSIFPDRLD